jgi:hypothetical protein
VNRVINIPVSRKARNSCPSEPEQRLSTLDCGVVSACIHPLLKENIVMFRVVSVLRTFSFWLICGKCSETDADMKIMQTAALCTPARGEDSG